MPQEAVRSYNGANSLRAPSEVSPFVKVLLHMYQSLYHKLQRQEVSLYPTELTRRTACRYTNKQSKGSNQESLSYNMANNDERNIIKPSTIMDESSGMVPVMYYTAQSPYN